MPLASAGKAGADGPEMFGAQYPQAGRPASAKDEPADGVFRDRVRVKAPSLAHAPDAIGQAAMGATLYVCTTCKAGAPVAEGDLPPGLRLYAALKRAGAPEGVRIVGVECLSACNTGCAVSLTKPGAWSYVYGRLTLDDVPAILEGAGKYAASPDGIVPWRDRPTVFRKQSIARIPPHPPHEEAAE